MSGAYAGMLRRWTSARREVVGASAESVVSSIAVMLRAGVPRAKVFAHLAAEHPEHKDLSAMAAAATRGDSLAEVLCSLAAPEWRALGAIWLLAEQSGGALADALERYARSLRSLTELRERRGVLLAGPRATVKLVAALPILAVGFGWLVGFDPLGMLLTPLGLVLVVVGVLLLVLGIWWASKLTGAVQREDRVAGLEFILLWVSLGGGASTQSALRRIADCVDLVGAEWVDFEALRRGGALERAISTALAHGVPLGALLLEEAEAAHMRARSELESGAERLGVRVLIPLGVCALPSFIVLGVLPVLLSMLQPIM